MLKRVIVLRQFTAGGATYVIHLGMKLGSKVISTRTTSFGFHGLFK